MKAKIIFILALVIATTSLLVNADAGPQGSESIEVDRTERIDPANYPAESVEALAGNLTQLSITGISQTKSWQGFFGNVTGTITLEDSDGFRFYDWSAANPQGQVYATVNETVTWTSVDCAPMHTDNSFLGNWHTFYGMNNSDYDSINNTYNLTSHPEIYVGYTTLNNCPTAYSYVNNASQTDDFPNLLLTSDADSTLIFTALLEAREEGIRGSKTGFDGGMYDFQLLVAEDGSNSNDDTTTYYFYVEMI